MQHGTSARLLADRRLNNILAVIVHGPSARMLALGPRRCLDEDFPLPRDAAERSALARRVVRRHAMIRLSALPTQSFKG